MKKNVCIGAAIAMRHLSRSLPALAVISVLAAAGCAARATPPPLAPDTAKVEDFIDKAASDVRGKMEAEGLVRREDASAAATHDSPPEGETKASAAAAVSPEPQAAPRASRPSPAKPVSAPAASSSSLKERAIAEPPVPSAARFSCQGDPTDMMREASRALGYKFSLYGSAPAGVNVAVSENDPLAALRAAGDRLGGAARVVLDKRYRTLMVEYAKAPGAAPAPALSFSYDGDLAGAAGALARKTGFTWRAEGPEAPMVVSVNASGSSWEEVVAGMNGSLHGASVFLDAKNRVLIVKYWK
jgi:hypothetical protein